MPRRWLIGTLAIFISEKEGLIPSDQYNGMEYKTVAEANALKAILATAKKSGLYLTSVAHDDGCPQLSGGFCNCKPDVTVGE
jgi:hypothetical protein